MNFQTIPRKYLYAALIVAIIILLVVTLVQPSNFLYKDTTNYDQLRKQAIADQERYNQLLAAIQPDYEASKQFLKKIATEEIVRQTVNDELDIKQRITVPTVADSELVINSRTDKTAVQNYLTAVYSMAQNYNQEVQPKIATAFGDAASTSDASYARQITTQFAQNLRRMSVPKEVLPYHKATIVAYDEYGRFFGTAEDYAKQINQEPWAQVYKSYSIIDNRMTAADTELNKLSEKYGLTTWRTNFAVIRNPFIKTAQAQFGGAVVVVDDVKRTVLEGIKTGLARAFARFATGMLDNLVRHIEKNFAIASQLYYSNELGRYYSVEYMKKFVEDPLDQNIIQQFLPEYFCVPKNKEQLRQIFTAKAQQNIGSDIVLDPNDPQFYTKLARIGTDEKNFPEWWEGYYETLALQTKGQAESAATKEVLDTDGFKSGRDLANQQIAKTTAAIFNVQEAAIAGTINLGTNNTENIVGQLVAGVIENLVNKFVFTPLGAGDTGGGGGLGVIQERNVCIRTPQIKPITSVPGTTYENPQR